MDNIEKLKTTAKEVEKDGSPFMEPKIEKAKSSRGRPPLSDEEKQKRSREKAEAQKLKAAQASQGPSPSGAQSTASPDPGFALPSKEIMRPVTFLLSSAAIRYANDPRAQMTPDETEAF